jgi:hypothetical protein
MNWMGLTRRTLLAMVLGCLVGAWLFGELRRYGLDVPPLVGAAAGLATAISSRRSDGVRGILVGAVAVWGAAVADVVAAPARGFAADLLAFSDRLDAIRAALFVGCGVLAGVMGSRGREVPKLV